jgi:hypothetical protein
LTAVPATPDRLARLALALQNAAKELASFTDLEPPGSGVRAASHQLDQLVVRLHDAGGRLVALLRRAGSFEELASIRLGWAGVFGDADDVYFLLADHPAPVAETAEPRTV